MEVRKQCWASWGQKVCDGLKQTLLLQLSMGKKNEAQLIQSGVFADTKEFIFPECFGLLRGQLRPTDQRRSSLWQTAWNPGITNIF